MPSWSRLDHHHPRSLQLWTSLQSKQSFCVPSSPEAHIRRRAAKRPHRLRSSSLKVTDTKPRSTRERPSSLLITADAMDNSNSYYPPTYFPGHMRPPSQPSGPSHLPGSHSNSHPHSQPQPHVQGYASYPGSAEQSRQSTAAPSPSVSGSSQSPSASASAPHAYPPAQGSGSGTGSGSASHGPLVEPHQDLNDFLESFWTRQVDNVEREEPDFKNYPLPLARIKKVMKSDEDVKVSRAGSSRIVESSFRPFVPSSLRRSVASLRCDPDVGLCVV
jgi:hypothetical protein